LQSSNIFIHEKKSKRKEIRVRLDAQYKIGSWAWRIVIESSISQSLVVKLVNEAIFIKLQ
jgi:hypothetical protein